MNHENGKPDDYDPPLPSKPTGAYPGTLEKIKVMRRRWLRGEQLHHPLDPKLDYSKHDQHTVHELRGMTDEDL